MVTTTIIPITTTTTLLLTTTTTITTSQQPSWEVFNTIIQAQNNIATHAITVVIAIALVLLGASSLWNFYISKRELENSINSAKEEITNKLKVAIKSLFETLEETTNKRIDYKINFTNAELARAFAVISDDRKTWDYAIVWFSLAIMNYAKSETEDKSEAENLLRICVDALNNDLDKVEMLDDKTLKVIEERLVYIPSILNKEKKEIQDKLDKLKKKKQAQHNLDLK